MKKVKIIVLRCSFNEGLLKGYGIERLHARSSEKVRCSTPDLRNRKVSVMAHGMPFIHMCLLWQDERVMIPKDLPESGVPRTIVPRNGFMTLINDESLFNYCFTYFISFFTYVYAGRKPLS